MEPTQNLYSNTRPILSWYGSHLIPTHMLAGSVLDSTPHTFFISLHRWYHVIWSRDLNIATWRTLVCDIILEFFSIDHKAHKNWMKCKCGINWGSRNSQVCHRLTAWDYQERAFTRIGEDSEKIYMKIKKEERKAKKEEKKKKERMKIWAKEFQT